MSKEPYPSETADRFIIRFPEGMRDRIRNEAAANNRSMNAEIIARLDASLEGRSISGEPITMDAIREESQKVSETIAKAESNAVRQFMEEITAKISDVQSLVEHLNKRLDAPKEK